VVYNEYPSPIIVPVLIAKVEKKPRLRPNLSVVSTAAILSRHYKTFKSVNPSFFRSSDKSYFDCIERTTQSHMPGKQWKTLVPIAMDRLLNGNDFEKWFSPAV